jgi:hypothetical protein
MDRRVGLTPVPDNANVEAFLQSVAEDHDQELFHVLVDMKATIEQTHEAGEPAIFAYGKLLNFLASDKLTDPDRLKLLAAALWELSHHE